MPKKPSLEDSKLRQIYGSPVITERHRHRYEMNGRYIEQLENAGMKISGYSAKQHLVEVSRDCQSPLVCRGTIPSKFTSQPRGGHHCSIALLRRKQTKNSIYDTQKPSIYRWFCFNRFVSKPIML